MDSLGGHILALEVRSGDSLCDIAEVHWLFLLFEDDKNLVANVFWVNGWPLGETPLTIKGREELADASDCFDVARVLVVKLSIELIDAHWGLVGLDNSDDFVGLVANIFFAAIFGDADGSVILIVFGDDAKVWRDFAEETELCLFSGVWLFAKNFAC